MAKTSVRISAPVGTRNGQTVMPNLASDLTAVTGLFDRISVAQGGSAEIAGVWATDRNSLIAEVTAQIVTFQTTNRRPVIDGVIDPTGGTLKLMNQLAADPGPGPGGISATVMPAPDKEDSGSSRAIVADVSTLTGSGALRPITVDTNYVRKLVRVDGCSITWFGVLIPKASSGQGSVPHINFTPTPIQGGYNDATYDSFAGWGQLWIDYTEVIGGQVAASGADQILVLPFYKTAQQRALGDFLSNWREAVAAAVTAAIDSIDATQLRDSFTFSRIVSSSFSNGYVAHQQFNSQAVQAADMTDVLFDLDGQAGGSNWRPQNGVIYLNRGIPGKINPEGNNFYVGGRWGQFAPFYGGNLNTHACCRNHLLYHGLWLRCT